MLGGSDKPLETALDSTEEPTPNKKKKKRRNNRQNAAEADKSVLGPKENETTPLQLIEDSVDVIDSKNKIGHSEERKAHENSEGAGSDGISKNEIIDGVKDENETE